MIRNEQMAGMSCSCFKRCSH